MTFAQAAESVRGKVVLITGGTGTIGVALARRLFELEPQAVRVFSRDENKQYFLKDQWSGQGNVRFFVGDVRDRERLTRAMEYCDLVLHLAALKHVESCEYNPFEAIKTNIHSTQNVIDVALDHQIEKVIFTSTDKAVNPANAMGASKLMAEKLMVAANYYKGRRRTMFASVRFGNVLASSGSVIPTFLHRLSCGLPIEVTHPEMTRFVITMDESVGLVLDALRLCGGGEILIRKMPVLRVIDLAEALLEIHGLPRDARYLRVVGPRAGEKMYEELITAEESTRTMDIGDYYVIHPQIREVRGPAGTGHPVAVRSYTSEQGPVMTKAEIRELLRRAMPSLFDKAPA
jgi:FlaA1/EpsC-like NDP-sugar epimerase